jgi:MoxR-like ATPase
VWTLPEWARAAIDRPCLIFIDELDKARSETVAALLTLITARTVRDERLHPGTRLIAAMQPVERSAWLADETLRALSARCVWLPLSHGLDHVAREVGLPEEELRKVCGASTTAIPPTLEIVSPRQLTAWFGIARLCDLADRAQGAIARTIAEGIGGRDRAEGLLALAHKASTAASSVSTADMIEAIIADDAVLDALDAAEIEALIAQAQKRGGECFSRFCAALARREQRLTRSAAP